MRFVVDGMLGGLARWLRILGHTVLYDRELDDKNLLDQTRKGMILLTRDEELYRRAISKKLPALMVSGRTESERLAQVSKVWGIRLRIDMETTLCPECGAELKDASKEEVSEIVPATSLRIYDRFWHCTNIGCGKVYWMGSHWDHINQTLAQARRIAGIEL